MGSLKHEEILEEFTEKVDKSLNGRVEKVILFGSYARNEQLPGSDIDLLIVLSDVKGKDQSKISQIARGYFLEHQLVLSPKIITSDELAEKLDYSFFQEIQKEGVEIYG